MPLILAESPHHICIMMFPWLCKLLFKSSGQKKNLLEVGERQETAVHTAFHLVKTQG
jgi:hypothetical protein